MRKIYVRESIISAQSGKIGRLTGKMFMRRDQTDALAPSYYLSADDLGRGVGSGCYVRSRGRGALSAICLFPHGVCAFGWFPRAKQSPRQRFQFRLNLSVLK